jgi:hypothetical protein
VLGGVDVREVDDARECLGYVTKPASLDVLAMPAARLVGLLDGLHRLRCVRTYGAHFRRVVDEQNDDEERDDDGRRITIAGGDRHAPVRSSSTGTGYPAEDCTWSSGEHAVRELWRTCARIYDDRRRQVSARRLE